MKKIFTKVKDYFTANACRKVFFCGLLITTVTLVLYLLLGRLTALRLLTVMFAVVTTGASMVDSMRARMVFVRQVKAMQYEHVQKLYAQQQAGQAVTMTATFSHDEAKYIRRKKWGFVAVILLKLGFCLAFISALVV